MLNLNNALIAGGTYYGNQSWNKEASSLDHCFKLYQVEDGEAILFSSGKKYVLEEGNCYFVNGFKIEKQYCPKSFRINWIHFLYGSVLLKQFFLKFPVATKLDSDEMKSSISIFRLFQGYFEDLKTKKTIKGSSRFSNYLKIQSLINSITGELLEQSEHDFSFFFGQNNRLFPAIEFINTNFKKKIALKQLAELCFMSENYFHSQFKSAFYITPNNYILQLRMNEALQLLTNPELSVSEVAIESGYKDPAFFSRTFTKYFSLSPKQYQKLLENSLP